MLQLLQTREIAQIANSVEKRLFEIAFGSCKQHLLRVRL